MTGFSLKHNAFVLLTLTLSGCGAMNNLDDMKTLVGEIKTMSGQMSDMDSNMKTVSGQMTSMGTNIQTMSGQMGDVDGNIKTMSGQMTGMGSNIQSMADQMTSMNTSIQTMATQMAVLSDMNTSIQKMATQMTVLGDMNASMKDLVTKMNVLTDMNATMKDMSSKMSLLSDMNTTMKDMSSKMGLLTAMNETMKTMGSKMDTMNSTLVGMGAQMSLLTDMNSTMKTMGTNLLLMNTAIQQMSTQMGLLSDMNTAMKDMRAKLDLLGNMNDTMKQMNSQMSYLGDMDTTMKDMGSKMSLLSDMNTAIQNLTQKLNALEAIKDNIEKMETQMAGLDGHIVVLSDKIGVLANNFGIIFTADHRIQTLQALEAAPDQISKLGYAAEYMITQEYQSWNIKLDPVTYRHELMDRSVPDFLSKVSNYITDHDSTDPSKNDSKSKDLYALAATLDYVNTIELDGLIGSDEKPVSMLSMIEDGIVAKGAVQTGQKKLSDLPSYQNSVIQMAPEAVYLLQVRQNFLQVMAFSLINEKKNGNPQSKMKSMWDFVMGRTLGTHFNSKVDYRNAGELELIATLLDSAADAGEFLVNQKIDPKTTPIVKTLLSKMTVPQDSNLTGSTDEFAHFEKALARVTAFDAQ